MKYPNSFECLKPFSACETCKDAYECGRNDEAADFKYEMLKEKHYDADPIPPSDADPGM